FWIGKAGNTERSEYPAFSLPNPKSAIQNPKSPMHRLSAKIAVVVALATAGLLVGLRLGGVAVPVWVAVVGGAGAGLAGYGAAYRLLARRLELARTTLRQIRKHRFDNLEAVHLPHGDELNALIWQVYRT